MFLKKNTFFWAIPFFLLAACGDDSGSSSGPSDSLSDSDLVVTTYDDLPVCSSKRDGATAYVKDEKTAYLCEDGDWTPDDSDKGKLSSSVSKTTSSSSKKTSSSSSASKSKSSSSVSKTASSSSFKVVYSSSIMPESSSSSSQKVILSSDSYEESSSSSLNGWNWNVPKEARMNPDIDYGTMTDERDGKVYKTVKIGDQTWMAENLNYADSVTTPSLKGKSWCFDDDSLKCDVAGRFYTWGAAIDSIKLATDVENPQNCGSGKTCTLPAKVQGVCPNGWHLPSRAEWNVLLAVVGGLSIESDCSNVRCTSTASNILKSLTGWISWGWISNGNGTDAFGFSVLPVGCRDYYGHWALAGEDSYFWSSTETDSYNVYFMHFNFEDENSSQSHSDGKDDGFSVRCLKD